MSDHVALIVGVGPGLGSALARRFAADGFRVAIAARRGATLQDLARHIRDANRHDFSGRYKAPGGGIPVSDAKR